jgi:AcrR family transcriptional regulator
VQDRRQDIIEAGLATLREHGYAGFTQPRVATRAGLRQSRLTYYYPTRVDLLAAVGRAAIDGQLAAADAVLDGSSADKVGAYRRR